MVSVKIPGWMKTRAALAMVRMCDDCCPSCRAAAADALGEPVARCAACGHPILPEFGDCPCLAQAAAADVIKAMRRSEYEKRTVDEILPELQQAHPEVWA